ncbi:MAG: aldo/keto reductase [Betaproteobacteria bacterium]|nr:aldo/keto reductase [Betaproteobacteria bacterium]
MKTRTLGGQITVNEVGYGCMGLSGIYGASDDAQSIALVRRIVDLGVNFFDSADAYGNGHNEELLGKALKGIRDKIVLATKFGQQRKPEGTIICGTPEYAQSACEASLKRLGIETIDLYFQHRVDKNVPIEDTIGAMAKLVKQGKVRHLGLSEVSVANLRRAAKVHPIVAVQSELSLWSRQDELDVLPVCRELGIGYTAYAPLGRGFLTGTVSGREALDAKDTRQSHPRFAPENIGENLKLAAKLKTLAASKGCTQAQLALAWILAKGKDIVPIPGTKSESRVVENMQAADIVLSAAEIKALEEIAPIGVTKGDRYPAANMKAIDR